MAPTRPQASRSAQSQSSTDLSNEEQQTIQAGRSATTLNAAASAHSLRQAAQRTNSSELRSTVSQPNLLRKKNKDARRRSYLQEIDDVPESEVSGVETPRPAASRPQTSAASRSASRAGSRTNLAAPASRIAPPAKLVQTSSNESTASSSSNHLPSRKRSSEELEESEARDALLPASSTQPPIPPIPSEDSPMTRPTTARSGLGSKRQSQLSLARLGTPQSVRDLGQDYDRYYNPFSTSRNNSSLDLAKLEASASLLSTSAADLKRFSNPFTDGKRIPSAYHSNVSTRPASPVLENVDEKRMHDEVYPVLTNITEGMTEKPGTPAFIREADPEKGGFSLYVDDRLGNPEYAFPLFVDTKEDDDDMHMPAWDDDIRLRPKLKDHFGKENIASTFGMLFMALGLLCIFIVLPVVSYSGVALFHSEYDTPLDQMPQSWNKLDPNAWNYVNDKDHPLLTNLRTGLIDPDTPSDAKYRTDINGNTLKLVYSDEFNEKNRTFYEGDDPYWYGFNGWYGATQDLEWYDPDALNTGDGVLNIQLDKFNNHGLNYRSGMLNSWNQLCFKGGVFEVSVSLPGPGGVHGFWPGVWTMGNLGRPGYLSTTDGLWPYTYNDCDAGITPNQSMTDGTSELPGQRLNKCTCENEDHPNPGTGRGAPEIDILEASAAWGGQAIGVATQSFQVAPFDIWYYPDYNFMETPNYNLSFVNTYTGGPFQQAVSTTTMLNNKWYDGKYYQKYAFEYAPGGNQDSYIQWYVGEEEMMKFDGRAIRPNGNVGQRLVSEEPMSMIINLGFSHSWVDIDFSKLSFPTIMRIDYVRLYQDPSRTSVTCDPPGYPTTDYIANHPAAYQNPNKTRWADTEYSWPKNTLMNGCNLPADSSDS